MYQAVYKCRLCGEIITNEIAMQSSAARRIMINMLFGNDELIENEPHPVHRYDFHFCRDGSLGFIDFQGFKKMEDYPMFEVIYISPSCKQAVQFITDLATELKNRGLGGFDIDRKNMQLKSDKYIVSAVDIFGGILGVSHHMTEYYIERVFLSYCGKPLVLERLKHLKRSFKEGAKEISEEELIKILMEVSA